MNLEKRANAPETGGLTSPAQMCHYAQRGEYESCTNNSLRGYFHRRAKSDVAQLDDRVVVLQAEEALRRAEAKQR